MTADAELNKPSVHQYTNGDWVITFDASAWSCELVGLAGVDVGADA